MCNKIHLFKMCNLMNAFTCETIAKSLQLSDSLQPCGL